MLLLLLARLIKRQVEVFRGFARRSSQRIYCQYGWLQRAVENVVVVIRRITTVVAKVASYRVDYAHVLTKDSAVTAAHLCQCSSCLPSQCLFGCGNGRWSAIEHF